MPGKKTSHIGLVKKTKHVKAHFSMFINIWEVLRFVIGSPARHLACRLEQREGLKKRRTVWPLSIWASSPQLWPELGETCHHCLVSANELLRWSLTQNYLQCLACLKLGVNTKFVFEIPEDTQWVFEKQKSHLRSVTSDWPPQTLPPPPSPSAEKITLSSVFF